MKKSLVLLLILTMVLSAFLVGCTPKQTEAPPATQAPATTAGSTEAPVVVEEPSGLLTVGIVEASGNFNPMYYSSAYDGYVVDLVFEGLIFRNFEGEYEGNVADSWEYSNDNKTITFKMKNDIVFSDGQPLTAHDVVFSYLILADPSYTGRYSSTVKDMVGYAAYYAGETDVFEGVVALDDYTVQFNFNDALRSNFANTGAAIMPKHYYGADFTPGNTASIETMTSAPIGSGPYVVDMFREKELVYLKRNANYTRPGYMIAEIILKFVDMTTDIVELTSGNVDLLAGMIEPKKIAEARNNGFTLNSYNRSGYGYVKTNHEFGPTKEKLVRQALFTAFNTEEFVNSYFYDKETDTVLAKTQFHPFSQISWAVTPEVLSQLTDYTFNLDKAKSLLDQAGWVPGADGLRVKDGQVLTLNIAAMPDHDILNTLIPMWERDWGQGLGIKLNVAFLEFNTILDYVIYNSDANVENWSLFFLATTIGTPDPHSIYTAFHSDYVGSGKDNTSRFRNAEVDRLLDQGKTIMDIEEAKPIYGQVLKILSEEAVMMPVYANTYFDIYAPKLVDMRTSSLYNWVRGLRDAKIVE